MTTLENYLENHEKEDFRNLINTPLNEVTGIEGYKSIKELTNDYDIWINAFYNEYSLKILKLIEYDYEVIKFKWLSQYILFGAIIFMIIFPVIISNYWLYFGLGLIPVAIFAMGIIKTPIHTFSWLIITGLIIYSILSGNYSVFGIIIPFLALILGPRNAKLLYRKTLIKSAIRSELCFKYLYYIGIILLHNRETDEMIKAKN